jgi:hypothetical protein
MAAVLLHGERTSTTHATGARRPPRWFTVSLVVQGVVLGVLGVCLFLGVDRVVTAWPWDLTPLVAQVTAAWLVSFAVAALMAVREDTRLLGPAGAGYLVFGAAEVLAAVLHRGDLDGGAATVAYFLMACWVALTGSAAVVLSRRHAQ